MASPSFEESIGFVGVGTINAAVITGLCSSEKPPSHVVLSPRGAKRAQALKDAFPELISVAKTNQEVADRCSWLVIAVLPDQAPEVLGALKLTANHKILSLMAGVSIDQLASMMPVIPKASIVRAVPLPPVAHHKGVTLVQPKHPQVMQWFSLLGTAVGVDDELKMAKMQTMTALMGAYYAQCRACHEWLVDQGVDSKDASTYVGGILHSIAEDSKAVGGAGFQGLIDEQTPGGYNEQGIRELTEAGVWDQYKATLTSINSRWEGKTKGSDGRPHVPRKLSQCEQRAHIVYGVTMAAAAVMGVYCVFFRSKR